MSHVRQQLREAAVTTLTGLATTGNRVSPNRVMPSGKGALPRLNVRTPQEVSEDTAMDGTQARTVRLVIDAIAAGPDEAAVSDLTDQIAVEVEEAVFAGNFFGGVAKAISYRGAALTLNGEGEKLVGVLSMSFDVTLYTVEGAPEAAL